MTKATLTILPPVLLATTALLSGVGWRGTIRILIAASCLYATCMSPWWIRNAVVLHAFVPFTTGSAMNLYLGNNPRNSEAGVSWATDVDPNVVAKISALPGELDRQHAYSKEAVSYIIERPGTFLLAAGKKLVRLWNIVPNAREFRSPFYITVSAASFAPVLALALICTVRWRQRWQQFAPLYLVIGYFTFLHVVTIASLRYRLPIEPLLIILAAEPLSATIYAVHRITERRLR